MIEKRGRAVLQSLLQCFAASRHRGIASESASIRRHEHRPRKFDRQLPEPEFLEYVGSDLQDRLPGQRLTGTRSVRKEVTATEAQSCRFPPG